MQRGNPLKGQTGTSKEENPVLGDSETRTIRYEEIRDSIVEFVLKKRPGVLFIEALRQDGKTKGIFSSIQELAPILEEHNIPGIGVVVPTSKAKVIYSNRASREIDPSSRRTFLKSVYTWRQVREEALSGLRFEVLILDDISLRDVLMFGGVGVLAPAVPKVVIVNTSDLLGTIHQEYLLRGEDIKYKTINCKAYSWN